MKRIQICTPFPFRLARKIGEMAKGMLLAPLDLDLARFPMADNDDPRQQESPSS
jgi:hypothetical protein